MGDHLRDTALPGPFRRLRSATWVSNLGDGVRNAALPLLAASIDGSAADVAVVAAAGTTPFAVLGLLAGTVADRVRRVPLVALAHAFRAVVAVAVAAAVVADVVSVPLLAGLALLLGCGEALADSAAPALVPTLVGDDQLVRANSDLETAELVANDLLGPPVGGTLLALAPWVPFALDAASFLGAAGLVRSIDHAEGPVPERPRTSWLADAREGARASWQDPVLRATGALAVLTQLGIVAAIAPIVVYLTDDLGLSELGFGLFLGVGSLGGVLGARAGGAVVARLGATRALFAAMATMAISLAAIAVPNLVVVALGYAIAFGSLVVARILVVTVRQQTVPDRLLGRAQGLIRSLLWASATVGALVGGVLSEQVDVRAPFLLASGLVVLSAVVLGRPLSRALGGLPAAAPAGARPGGAHLRGPDDPPLELGGPLSVPTPGASGSTSGAASGARHRPPTAGDRSPGG